ncbi:hypothetical protein AGR1A_pAt20569 [Agrobacterium fabacearum CFBP 5771]|jgi:hypothetical protein|nr:hypothetical protein AGR1A_pAt20569 [Agrobacterium fabacearum CFBP 5771]
MTGARLIPGADLADIWFDGPSLVCCLALLMSRVNSARPNRLAITITDGVYGDARLKLGIIHRRRRDTTSEIG